MSNDEIKILIADDEQDCIDFVRDALADTSYTVISASDGEEALEVARREQPCLVILDVQMPKLDGFGVFAQLRQDEKLSKVPVIMLTGAAEKTGIKTGAKDMGEYFGSEPEVYIDKPIEPIILKQAVKKLLRGF
jgi:two-component system, OmpR family, alkaline phosphatase synthesis response regulator PhoP